jgi:hypothetical protein
LIVAASLAIVLILGGDRPRGVLGGIGGIVTWRGIAKLDLLHEIGEAVGHGRQTRLIVLSQPPPDFSLHLVLHDNPTLGAADDYAPWGKCAMLQLVPSDRTYSRESVALIAVASWSYASLNAKASGGIANVSFA